MVMRLPALVRYYPRASDLLRQHGVERLQPIKEYYPMDRARERLGFQPLCNFEQWLEDLKARPEERADKSSPWS